MTYFAAGDVSEAFNAYAISQPRGAEELVLFLGTPSFGIPESNLPC